MVHPRRLPSRLLAPYRAGVRGLDPRILTLVGGTFLFLAARMSLLTFLAIFFVEERGVPIALVGTAFFLENVVRGLVGPASGALSDRIGRLPVLLASVGLTALVVPAFLLVHGPLGLLLWSGAMGVVQGPFFPSAISLLLDLAPAEARQRVLALNYVAIARGVPEGVVPGGFLASAGFGWLALASMAGFLGIGVAFLLRLRGGLPRPLAGAERASFIAHTLAAARDATFVRFSLLSFGFPLGIGLVSLAVPLYATEGGLSERTVGLVLGVNGLLIAVLALPVNARLESRGPFRLLPLAALLLAGSYLLLLRGTSPFALALALAVFALGELLFSATLPVAVDALAPPGSRGAYQGAWGFVFALGVGAALLVAGLLRTTVGWAGAWLAFALLMAAAAVALALARRGFRRVADERGAAR